MERAIIDGPLPDPLPVDLLARLRQDDPTLDNAVRVQAERCHGQHPGGRCSPDALCSECQAMRRVTALAAHRATYGMAPHPSEILDGDGHGDAWEGDDVRPECATADGRAWPAPPAAAAYHGLAGEVVRTIEPNTESDPVAVLTQFLVATGNAVGRGAYYQVEARRHYPNLYQVLVGKTAKGRKGTAWGWVEALFPDEVAPGWGQRVQTGLSSGEGLIWAVRDEIKKKEPVKQKGRITGYQDVLSDEGVADKRLLVIEEEFAQVLRQGSRDGNTLSAVIRQAWDTGNLRSMTKNSPARSTGAHVSIVGHITQQELLKCLSQTETGNGFANRFLWVCSRRSKLLPDGGGLMDLSDIQGQVAEALRFAAGAGRMQRDPTAARLWRDQYPYLSRERPGVLGLVTNRAEAQVLRLSLVYALLDCSEVIREEHLRAALAVWDYAERSCRWIFGETTGDRDADRLLEAIRAAGADGLTRTRMMDVFGRNKSAAQLDQLLAMLVEFGLVIPGRPATGGRPAEKWRAAGGTNTNPTNPTNPGGLHS